MNELKERILKDDRAHVMTPAALLFDLDGTLTASAPGILNSVRYALRKVGAPIPDETTLNRFIGPPLIDSFMKYCGFSQEAAEQALADYREYFTQMGGLFENSVYAGVVPMLETLRAAGKKILLATAKPEAFARRILEHFGLTRHFDAIHGATMDEKRNRKAGVIAWALAHSGELGRAVMVGDRADDVLGAKANGLETIGVLYGYGDADELNAAGAAALAVSPAEVVRLVLGDESGEGRNKR